MTRELFCVTVDEPNYSKMLGESLESNLPKVQIPVEILRKNSTVDPILQNIPG